MNYQHAFHAGNHADMLKHCMLDAALALLARKSKPLVAIDAFGGAGLYDLRLDARADRTGEWRDGVSRLWLAREREADGPLGGYLARLAEWNSGPAVGGSDLRWLPGSPLLARAALRADDKLLVVEMNPDECQRLSAHLEGDRRTRVYCEDGWRALRSFLPPTPRRGLVLIDPPFEAPGELDRMAEAARDGLRRWSNGVFMLWRPIKSGDQAAAWAEKLLAATAAAPTYSMALTVRPNTEAGLIGSALDIINPPYGFEAVAEAIGARLEALLAASSAAGFSADWLRAPT